MIKALISSILVYIKNFIFCLKYPFWRSRNIWTDKPYGYSYTKYDDIPEGWRKAFGIELSEALRKQLIKDDNLHKFRFIEIKEKWGYLCLYNNGGSEELLELIHHYEDLSACYCYKCGKPARYKTIGWIEYLCDDCSKDSKRQRLTENDIPKSCLYDMTTGEIVEKKLNIDYHYMWGLEEEFENSD